MRVVNFALDGRALQLSLEGSPGGGEASGFGADARRCSDRPALSPDFRASGVSVDGQEQPSGSGGKSSGMEVGDDPVAKRPSGLPPTPTNADVRQLEAERYGEEASSPICPGAESRSCNEMPIQLGQVIAREWDVSDSPIGAPSRTEGAFSRVQLNPTKEPRKRRSKRGKGRVAVLDERLGPSVDVKTSWARSCKLPLPGGEDPDAPTRDANPSGGEGDPYIDTLTPKSIHRSPARDRGEPDRENRTSFQFPSEGAAASQFQSGKRGDGEMVCQCQEVDAEFAGVHKMLGLTGAALVCRVTVELGGKPLVACIDTGATFSLLADKMYEELQDALPPLQPAHVELSGAGGESLNVKGAIEAKFRLGDGHYDQRILVGRLEGLDLLLGMDWLTTYGVNIDCATKTVRIGEASSTSFGQVLAVLGKDLVRLTKTVRVRPRGVQRVLCHIKNCNRVGQEVLVEGTVNLGGELFVVPSLEVIRDDGSLPLTLENQSTDFREIPEGMIVAKVTGLTTEKEERPQEDVNRTSDGGETPPVLRIWQIPTQVANTNAIGTRHGMEWTSRQLIPEEKEDKSSRRQGDCKVYFAEEKAPAGLSTEPTQAGDKATVPEFLRCMFPAEETLTADEMSKLEDLVMEYEDIFLAPDGSPGYTDLISHKIDTGDALPIKQNYYRRSMKEREYVDAEVEQMLANGVIRPSKSPWGAPVVLVRKKTGELRFCIDFRQLNEATKKDAYPLPRIDECLDALEGSKFFSTLDLASGYWQVAMDPEDAEKTAFVTHRGLFEWTRMPFGLCNAPATFCRLMEMVLADIVWSQCLVYLDDILAFGRNFEVASLNLRAVFERLRRANLKLKPKKCRLFATSVEYLGHEVDKDGIRPSRSKVQALHNWDVPRTLTEVRTYLGFTGYYRRFVPNYSELAKPLTGLTKKGVRFHWEEQQLYAFRKIKWYIEQLPLLYYPVPDKEFHLKVDASLYGIGGTLEQEQDGICL